MDLHSRARTCPASRALLVQRVTVERWTVPAAAVAAGISVRTVYKWLARARQGDPLRDRSSRPHRSPRTTPEPWRDLILELRRTRMTGAQISVRLKLRRSTVARVLQRAGMARLRSLEPPEPVVRYEHQQPGELVHLDIKPLVKIGRVGHRIHGDRTQRARGIGWEYAHVAIDDYSRVAYVEVLPRQDGPTTVAFLRRALDWFRDQGIRVRRIMSDNGSGYVAKVFRAGCLVAQVRHLRTRPYRPQTNWQSRALHPNPAARMGVRATLSHLETANGGVGCLAPPLQSSPPAWQSSWSTTLQPTGGQQ